MSISYLRKTLLSWFENHPIIHSFDQARTYFYLLKHTYVHAKRNENVWTTASFSFKKMAKHKYFYKVIQQMWVLCIHTYIPFSRRLGYFSNQVGHYSKLGGLTADHLLLSSLKTKRREESDSFLMNKCSLLTRRWTLEIAGSRGRPDRCWCRISSKLPRLWCWAQWGWSHAAIFHWERANFHQISLSASLQTLVRPQMVTVASVRPYAFQQGGAPAHTSPLFKKWLSDNWDIFWSKEFWPQTVRIWILWTINSGPEQYGFQPLDY